MANRDLVWTRRFGRGDVRVLAVANQPKGLRRFFRAAHSPKSGRLATAVLVRWSNSVIVVSVIVTLGVLTVLGRLSGTDVIPMLMAVLTYSLGFHVVTVSGESSKDNSHSKDKEE